MHKAISTYTIQEWLFNTAEGKFDFDLAESGIQYHFLHDLDLSQNYDLNYSLDCGKLALRQKVAELYSVDVSSVAITHGAQEGLYLFYRSFLKSTDHVIAFKPGWQQSWEVPTAIGCEVSLIALQRENAYQIDLKQVIEEIKDNTKLIVLTNPNNPTGVTVSQSVLKDLIDLCEKKDIFLMADEEYFTDYQNSLIKKCKNAAIVSGLSKVYGFPGLRCGWFIGPSQITDQVINYKRYVTVSNSSLCEYLGLQVLDKHEDYLQSYKEICQTGQKFIERWSEQHDELEMLVPHGTPFAYMMFKQPINTQDFCEKLLVQQKVLLMPAEVFSDEYAVRVSFGRHVDVLTEALTRISEHLSSYRETEIVT